MGGLVEKLVEYRTVHYSAISEAATYLTNQQASVSLGFANPIVCRMIAGHKIMRVGGSAHFHFVPGETVLVPPDMRIDIDFPSADLDNPTVCACIEIERQKVDGLLERINDERRRTGRGREVLLNWGAFALYKGETAIDRQFDRLLELYRDERSEFREMLIDVNLSELVLRLLQVQAKRLLIEATGNVPDTGLNAVARFLIDNPEHRVDPESLAEIAGMSAATFFRRFRAKFGTTPSRFANQARIHKARELLIQRDATVTGVAFELGFQSVGHFVRVFKQVTGETPGEYMRRSAPPQPVKIENLMQRIDRGVSAWAAPVG